MKVHKLSNEEVARLYTAKKDLSDETDKPTDRPISAAHQIPRTGVKLTRQTIVDDVPELTIPCYNNKTKNNCTDDCDIMCTVANQNTFKLWKPYSSAL